MIASSSTKEVIFGVYMMAWEWWLMKFYIGELSDLSI